MKKAIILIAFIVVSGSVFSQMKPFRFGFKAAPNLGWLTPNSERYDNEGTVLGFNWGFLGDFTLMENYFIQTGFNVHYVNGKLQMPFIKEIDDNIESGTLKRKYNLRYFEIPVTFKMRTKQFGKIAFMGRVGLGSSFRLKAQADDEFSYEPAGQTSVIQSDDEKINIGDNIVFVKESLILGLGAEYFIDSSTSLFLEIEFNNGFTDILKGKNTRYEEIEQEANLNFIALNFGVIF